MSATIDAMQAVLDDDEERAVRVLETLDAQQLHELQRVALMLAHLARTAILGPADR